jgi:hypothetical protein
MTGKVLEPETEELCWTDREPHVVRRERMVRRDVANHILVAALGSNWGSVIFRRGNSDGGYEVSSTC